MTSLKEDEITERLCKDCERMRPLELLCSNATSVAGRMNLCKECASSRERKKYRQNPKLKYERTEAYRKTERGKQVKQKTYTNMWAKYPEKMKARVAVGYAVRSGKLIKPTLCPRCGKAGRIEGHHPDYSKSLEVLWLCSYCHKGEHGVLISQLKGEEA